MKEKLIRYCMDFLYTFTLILLTLLGGISCLVVAFGWVYSIWYTLLGFACLFFAGLGIITIADDWEIDE